jgi:hypothetical protein
VHGLAQCSFGTLPRGSDSEGPICLVVIISRKTHHVTNDNQRTLRTGIVTKLSADRRL